VSVTPKQPQDSFEDRVALDPFHHRVGLQSSLWSLNDPNRQTDAPLRRTGISGARSEEFRLAPPGPARGGLRVLKYSHRPDGQGAAVDDLLGSGILVSAFIYINWAYDVVDRRAIEGALARAPGEQREAVMSVMAQEREQGRAEGKAEGKAETLLRLLDRHFQGVPEA
jgi:hypothetical protein